MRVRLVYVAGPYSAPTRAGVEANIARAVDLALGVAKLGAMPVCPHSNTSDPRFEAAQPYDFWIKGTLALLRPCHALITTEYWHTSSGARGEVADAQARGVPVFQMLSELESWLWRINLGLPV